MSRARNLAGFSSASTNAENPVNIRVGYVTAIAYYGDGSGLTGTPGGLGTALSDNVSSPLNKIYYTNANLSIASTIIVDPPQSASAAYTQYTDIVMQGDADLIVADGDTFIPDILGIGTFVDEPGILTGGNGKVRADNYTDKLGSGAAYGPYGFVTPVGVAVTVGSGTSISSPGNNTLTLGTNNLERLRITSAGNIGIGTDAFTAVSFGRQIVEIEGASGALINLAVGGTRKAYQFTDGSDVYSYNTANGDYIIGTNNTEKVRIAAGGDVNITDGNLVVASGHGIDFSANPDGGRNVTANLLDDYEEGTHTTVFTDSGSGTITVSSGNDQLSYIKVGNLVNVIGRPTVGSVSSPTGYLQMTLPFTSADVADAGARSAAALNLRLVDTGYDVGLFSAQMEENSSILNINYGGSTDSTPSGPAMKTGTQIWINITYRVA